MKQVYRGIAKLYTPKKNGSQIAIVEVQESKVFFALELEMPVGICGRHGASTQIEGTSIVILRQYDSPLRIKHVESEDVNLYDNLLSYIGYNHFMRGLRNQEVFSKFATGLCNQEKKILQNRLNIIRNHPSSAMFELEGKQGYLAQTRGAAIQLIKCTSAEATYRHIEDDTEEIPVLYKGRPMFADPVSFILKPNATKIRAGTYMPVRWKIGSIWYCKNGKRTICAAPVKLQPESSKKGNYMLEFEDLPLAGGMLTPAEIKEHETTIFYEETKAKAMDDMADDLINLRPTRISKTFSSNMLEYLYELFWDFLSQKHTIAALVLIFLGLLNHLFGFLGRVLHFKEHRKSLWDFLLTPFDQIFNLTVLQRLQKKEEEAADLSQDLKNDINKVVKIDIAD